MSKIKYIILLLFMSLMVFLIPNTTNAAVDVNRNIYSNNGSMKFTFTGLELDMTHEYEYGFTVTAATEVEDWFLITEYTETTAVVDLITTTSNIKNVYGYILVDNLSPEVSDDNQPNQSNENHNNNDTDTGTGSQNNVQINGNDNTTATIKLPDAGVSTIIRIILFVTIICTIGLYVKYRKYKGIK